jgi:hypothetical protein
MTVQPGSRVVSALLAAVGLAVANLAAAQSVTRGP